VIGRVFFFSRSIR